MKSNVKVKGKKWHARKLVLWGLLALIVISSVVTFFVLRNFNQLLANALMRSYDSNIISDVYELRFKKLKVNIFEGNIQVLNVVMQPRAKPLNNYPYINSSFRLTTGKILLQNVKLFTLLKSNKLILSKIQIINPDILVNLAGKNNIMMPYQDTTTTLREKITENKTIKAFINSYFLQKFELDNASFRVINSGKQREFKVRKLNISLNDLMINQLSRKDVLTFKNVVLSIGEISGKLKNDVLREVIIKDYKLDLGELKIQKSIDTLIFSFKDLNTSMKNLDIQTEDSIFDISAQSIAVSYRNKSADLVNLAFKPNINRASLQKRYNFQTAQVSGTIGTIKLLNVNFDTLVYKSKIVVDEIKMDKVEISVYKDKTIPLNKNRIPEYLSQQLTKIPIPLTVNRLKATNIDVVSRERKADGNYAKVIIKRGMLEAGNISTQGLDKPLTLKAEAYIENKVYFNLDLSFSYLKPEFIINGNVAKFNLPDLNPLFLAYAPVNIKKGTTDGITFSATAYKRNAKGTMKFLYHDLDIDLQLENRAKWINSIMTFAANTYIASANPPKAGKPPRIVKFEAERDMNKGFINIIIRSFLSGMKETMMAPTKHKKEIEAGRK